ncbi:alpha-soluble NSF attachment protein [Nematocida sp. AWRm77]|nr:alpha-soluble NSF attachment protein [Nematocida sp. AWRm77]
MSYRTSPEDLEKKADSSFKRSSNFFLRLFTQTDKTEVADLYIQAAQAYCNTSNYAKTAELFYKAGEILLEDPKEESQYEASSAFVKSAEAYYIIDKEKSINAYVKGFQIFSRRISDFSMAAILAMKVAKILKEVKREKEALEYLYKATSLYGNAKMNVNRRSILVQCAEVELKLKNYEKAFDLYRELADDDSAISQVIEKTTYMFLAVLCAVILSRTKEAYEILNQMDEQKVESLIAYQMLEIKTKKTESQEELERNLAYFKKTHKIPKELASALQDAQMSIDPDHDIL